MVDISNQPQRMKYRIVADLLRRRIAQGELRPGDRLPSFAALHAEHQLGTNTINRVFLELEKEGLVERRQGSGVYVAQPTAPSRRYVIGLPSREMEGSLRFYGSHLLSGIRRGASQLGAEVVWLDVPPALGWERVDGILLLGHSGWAVEDRLPFDMPAVDLMWEFGANPAVTTDNHEASRRATRYLLELGHRRIGFLGQTGVLPTAVRLNGYQRELELAGIIHEQSDRRWVHDMSYGRDMIDNGRTAMEQWLREGFQELGCTALLAQNDRAAMGIIQALQSTGLRVPDDISVIGFDGTDECELCSPRLTTMEVPLEAIGARAVALLLSNIETKPLDLTKIILPSRLVERDSTAPPKV